MAADADDARTTLGLAGTLANRPLPDGITLAFLNETKDRPAEIAIIFLCALAFVVVLLRAFSRVFFVKIFFGLDDVMAIISMLLHIAFATLSIILIRLGSGRHYLYIQYALPLSTVNKTETIDFVAHLLYTTALFTCRCSGLAFYHRLCEHQRGFRLMILAAFVFLICAYLPQMFLIIFHCTPVTSLWPYDWQPEYADYQCLMWGTVYVTNSSFSLVCDLVIFTIPALIIRSLHLPLKRKLQISVVMLPGILVIAISITRLYLVAIGQWKPDESWSYDPLLAVENAEIAATLIALSIPSLKPLAGKWASIFSANFINQSPDRSPNRSRRNCATSVRWTPRAVVRSRRGGRGRVGEGRVEDGEENKTRTPSSATDMSLGRPP